MLNITDSNYYYFTYTFRVGKHVDTGASVVFCPMRFFDIVEVTKSMTVKLKTVPIILNWQAIDVINYRKYVEFCMEASEGKKNPFSLIKGGKDDSEPKTPTT